MSRFIVRPVLESDFSDLKKLASSIQGLTSLPNNDEILLNKIHDSLKAFSPYVRKPGGESYLFVIEDLQEKRVIGTSGIISKVGGFDPFYTYRVKTEHLTSEVLKIEKDVRVLHLHVNHNGPTEICSLLVDPQYRKHGLGRLASLSRFIFMADFSSRFDKTVISELRGVVNENDKSPFWECVGKHFFDTDFYHADYLTGMGNKEVIAALMPKHPIYVELLPHDAQAVIGKVHRDTRPAKQLLENEGFSFLPEVDIFDAGPTVSAQLKNIRTVQKSRKAKIAALSNVSSAEKYLISNSNLDFRCVVDSLKADGNSVEISAAAAKSLNIKEGDEIRYVESK